MDESLQSISFQIPFGRLPARSSPAEQIEGDFEEIAKISSFS